MPRSASIDRERVRALYDDYVALLDEGDFDSWLELFVEESVYRIVAAENFDRGLPLATVRCDSRRMLADRIFTIRSTQTFAPRRLRHFVSGIRIGASTASARSVRASFLVIESLDDEPSRVHVAGRYVDVVTESEGCLKFLEKVAVYDSPIIPVSLVYPV